MSGNGLATAITRLMDDPREVQRIGDNAAGLGRRDAAQVIVDQMLNAVRAR